MEQDKVSRTLLMMNFPNVMISKPIAASNDIDLMVGSPPCIGFSKASPISRLDHPCNKHTLNFAEAVAIVSPKHFLMEMVPEILTKGKPLFQEYCDILRPDYNYDYAVMDAAEYGSAQHRNRLYVFGRRRDLGNIESPLCTLNMQPALSISDVVPEEVSRKYDVDNYKPDTRMLMSLLRTDGKPRAGPFSLLATPERKAKRTLTGKSISFTLVKFSTHNQIYQREKGERFFSTPELQLIMGFPLSYRFPDKNVQEKSRMIASGVDIRFATYLLKHIRDVLE
jgi:DNA (cytosine-5)-methyltransferase 1